MARMKISGIPPITSTGSTRSKIPSPLQGLAHMSLGRYMTEMAKIRKNEEESSSWNPSRFAKSDFNRKSKKKTTPPILSKVNRYPKLFLFTSYKYQ